MRGKNLQNSTKVRDVTSRHQFRGLPFRTSAKISDFLPMKVHPPLPPSESPKWVLGRNLAEYSAESILVKNSEFR